MAFNEDLAQFFRTEDFADEVTISGQVLKAIFQDEYVESNGIAGKAPVIYLRTASLPALTWGATTCIHAGVTYKVAREERDGTGVSRLVLLRSS